MKLQLTFPVKYAEIKKRLAAIQPLQYGKTRNFINGAVSHLSPYISRGVISTKQVLQQALQEDIKQYSVYKFIKELAWRDYFQLIYKEIGDDILKDIFNKQKNATYKRMPAAVYNALTGIDVLDEQIKLFYTTGYMHNHVRMYTAAVTCNIAKTYWLQPSRWLYFNLLDGDVASNTCGWQWVAGCISWKKYYCNQDNINRYLFSEQKETFLDKSYSKLVNMNVPDVLKKRKILKLATKLPETSSPIIDTTKATLIYNSYSLDPLWRKSENVNRLLLLEPSHFKQFPVSEKVMEFIINLSNNIKGIHVYAGEVSDVVKLYKNSGNKVQIISKEHPAFTHYPGIKDERDWMFPEITGLHKTYGAFWKKADSFLKQMKAGK